MLFYIVLFFRFIILYVDNIWSSYDHKIEIKAYFTLLYPLTQIYVCPQNLLPDLTALAILMNFCVQDCRSLLNNILEKISPEAPSFPSNRRKPAKRLRHANGMALISAFARRC